MIERHILGSTEFFKKINLPNDFLLILESIKNFAQNNPLVRGAFVIGSVTRHDFDLYSDVDACLVISHDQERVIHDLKETLASLNQFHITPSLNKLSFFLSMSDDLLSSIVKLDLFVTSSIDDVIPYIYGSYNGQQLVVSLLSDKEGVLSTSLTRILSSFSPEVQLQQYVEFYFNQFVSAFYNASTARSRLDDYRFNFELNIAYHSLVSLSYILHGSREYLFLPKGLLSFLPFSEKKTLEDLRPHQSTRNEFLQWKYLQSFVNLLKRIRAKMLIPPKAFDPLSTQQFLERILTKNLVINFRDVAIINPNRFKPRTLFRSSTLTEYQNHPLFPSFLRLSRIKTILDIRSKEEQEKSPYDFKLLSNYDIKYTPLPIDPYRLSPEEVGVNTGLSDEAQFYAYFPKRYALEVGDILRSIYASEKPVLLHCTKGKDRTGMIIALLFSILGFGRSQIMREYSYSYPRPLAENLSLTFSTIDELGGIHSYLLHHAGMSSDEIVALASHFLK